MVKKIIDLSNERFKKLCFNPFSDLAKNIIKEPLLDSVFGWGVLKAEVSIDSNTNSLIGYSLMASNGAIQAIAKRIVTNEIEYWHYEYLGRDVKTYPDMFQPKMEVFLAFFYEEFVSESVKLQYDLSLPVVTYEKSRDERLKTVRYSLSVNEDNSKPLLYITIGEDGFLHTISDWQNIKNKHIVLPTSNSESRYLLQDFSAKDTMECGSHNTQRFETKSIKKTLVFEGLDSNYEVYYLFDSNIEKDLRKFGFYITELRDILSNKELLLKYIPTINYHILEPCDMVCNHCFSDFGELKKKFLIFDDAKKIVKEIAKIKSFRKLNFSGGEPTLFKDIEYLVGYTKAIGINEVSLVSNGYKLSCDLPFQKALLENLDILALSIDSFDDKLNIKIGRYKKGKSKNTVSLSDIENLAIACEKEGVKIKINTVVTKLNCDQILVHKIAKLKPIRWKILRMLPLIDQNSRAQDLFPSDEEYEVFVKANSEKARELGVEIISEDNEDMTGSYLMISPDGRFFNNLNGKHGYSEPILSVGIKKALSETPLMREVFYKRGGDYEM